MGPWSPNWRPDPTGGRLIVIRIARQGALLAAVIFGALVALAAGMTPAPATKSAEFNAYWWLFVALFCVPGLALLGAGLALSALGSRSAAAVAGVAMGVGVPVAAVTSALIGTFVLFGFVKGLGDATEATGVVLRIGVTAAVRISPLIALGSVAWVVLVRRFART